MSDNLRDALQHEHRSIQRLVSDYGELVRSALIHEPSPESHAALAAVLHSFYGGVENAMRWVAESIDGGLAKTASWHTDLLESMARSTPARPALFTEDLAFRLREYLGFRHVFRSHYAFELDWSRMRPLVERFEPTLHEVADAIDRFLTRPGGPSAEKV